MLTFVICVIWISAAANAQLMDCPFEESEMFNNLDECSNVPETTFELYTRENAYVYQELKDEETVLLSNYDPGKRTVIAIHQYGGDPSSLFALKFAYLQYMDCNFIMVNWKVGASETNYLQAGRNVPIIAKYVAEGLEELKDYTGCQFKNVHIIGWSLGAQIAGFIGKYVISEKIGRITALDPAGVCFEGFSAAYKLHITDADLVDVILTSSGPVIANKPIVHMTFRPDGGREARGCANIIDGSSPIVPLCSHARAVELFTASLKTPSNCLHIGYTCPDYDTYESGDCFTCGIDERECAIMGIHADLYANKTTEETKVFYLDTTFTDDFCLLQYHVEVVIASTADRRLEVGILNLVINKGLSNEMEIMLKPSANKIPSTENLIPGVKYTYLVNSHKSIQSDTVRTVDFFWISFMNDEASRLYISCVTILPMNNINYFHEYAIFATAGNQGIPPEVIIPLQITENC